MKLVRTYNLNFVLALRQGVDFVLPLSQEDQEQEQEKEEQEPSHQNLSEGGVLRRLKFDA